MRASFALFFATPLLSSSTAAQDPASSNWNPTAALLAVTADLSGDRDGAVTSAEWSAFLDPVEADAAGRLSRAHLKARIMIALLDEDGDGELALGDIDAVFGALDVDGDGALTRDEVLGSMREANGDLAAGTASTTSYDVSFDRALARELVVTSADGDGSRTIDAQEWSAFQSELASSQESIDALLLGWMRAAEIEPPPDDRNAFTPGVYLLTLDSELDLDHSGRLESADLARAFADLDTDRDGRLTPAEIAEPPGAFAQEEANWHRPTAADWEKPCLIPWQRNLEDALALVERTGKPLLVCVNMNDETACDSLASRRYRDPAFARLVEGFVPLIVSPDQRNPRDYDDRGARIPDPKFGRVLNSEAIGVESAVYERYFEERRVAPRHVGVSPGGEILFDIFLIQGPRPIDEALRTHGVRAPRRAASELSDSELFASPDAADRDELERRFLESDASRRAALVARALRPTRGTTHPQLVRMALRDEDADVRNAAANAVAAGGPAAAEFYYDAFRTAAGDLGLRSALADAAHALGAEAEDAAVAYANAQRARTFEALTTETALFDVARWRLAVPGAPAAPPAIDAAGYDALVNQLEELTAALEEAPDDRELRVMQALTALRCADARMTLGMDPTFLLQDTERFAAHATSADAPEGRALALMAHARWFQGDPEGAGRHAAAAMPHLLPHAQTDLARRTLNVLANSRARSIYAAMGEQRAWPARWLSEAHAAFRVLVAHPGSEEADARAHMDLMRSMGAYAEEGQAALAALERFPTSSDLHNYLRFQLLRDGGAETLEDAYRELDVPANVATTVSWFDGLASLVAAEHHVQCKQPEAAIDAYRRSVRTFGDVVAEAPGFADSSNHYVALALAGAARLHADAGEWDEASELLVEGISVRPASAASPDGLGNSPAATASYVTGALRDAGEDERAETLRTSISEYGVDLGG